ncbi:ATP-binding protein [Rhodococcus sp. NPDC058505]|uniref:HAMP domain-containing sensor histidine kinase n=1 Tax=unclassified Rhodococcus (in: high G+C Gram-positive bacteria) TaxID=192944 RepID=UPI00364877A7
MRLPRPLDPFGSFKVKTGLLVVASVFAASVTFWFASDWQFRFALGAALLVSLVVTQVLAHGMTSPLREMTAAARAMATGDWSRRVRATSRDEIGELARAFNQMAEDLEADDRYRRELIANVSHELRTPIAALQGVLENVVDGVAAPDPATLRSALDQTERLGALVRDLLDLSRLEAGVVPVHRDSVEIAPFLRAVIDERADPTVPVDIRLDVRPVTLRASADTARLHQVVANLIDNALRHGAATQVLVRATAGAAAGSLIVDVHDDGPGIAPEDRAGVFERFSRGGASGGGTGLGLAIARWAVELHGGRIGVLDTETGCCIRVEVPAPAKAGRIVQA